MSVMTERDFRVWSINNDIVMNRSEKVGIRCKLNPLPCTMNGMTERAAIIEKNKVIFLVSFLVSDRCDSMLIKMQANKNMAPFRIGVRAIRVFVVA